MTPTQCRASLTLPWIYFPFSSKIPNECDPSRRIWAPAFEDTSPALYRCYSPLLQHSYKTILFLHHFKVLWIVEATLYQSHLRRWNNFIILWRADFFSFYFFSPLKYPGSFCRLQNILLFLSSSGQTSWLTPPSSNSLSFLVFFPPLLQHLLREKHVINNRDCTWWNLIDRL